MNIHADEQGSVVRADLIALMRAAGPLVRGDVQGEQGHDEFDLSLAWSSLVHDGTFVPYDEGGSAYMLGDLTCVECSHDTIDRVHGYDPGQGWVSLCADRDACQDRRIARMGSAVRR